MKLKYVWQQGRKVAELRELLTTNIDIYIGHPHKLIMDPYYQLRRMTFISRSLFHSVY